MKKIAVLLLIISPFCYLANDEMHQMETQEFVEALEDYFTKVGKDKITKREAADIFMMVYLGLSVPEVEEIEAKINNDSKLTEDEEHFKFFKEYIAEYFEDSKFGEDGFLLKEEMIEIVRGNHLLNFMEERLDEEKSEVQDAAHRYKTEKHFVNELDDEKLKMFNERKKNVQGTTNFE
jgi:hypothetical protein